MLTREEFKARMTKLKDLSDQYDEMNNHLSSCHIYIENDVYPNTFDFVIDLLKFLMEDEYDTIGYFVYELDWGQRMHASCCIHEDDGSITSLQNLDELYDYLKGEKENESV